MDLIFSAYLAALVIGAVHAIEVDHMVAVSVFAGLKPRMKAAASYGARWGLGHAAVVILVGGLLAWLDIKVPDSIVGWSEVLVGLALIALGLWALRSKNSFHSHGPEEHDRSPHSRHGHLHAHGGDSDHQHVHRLASAKHHQHLPAAMGALHGLAGSAPVLALIPITLLESFSQSLTYLLLFSVGTTLSMSVYALLAASAVQGMKLPVQRVRQLTAGIAGATVGVGVWWIIAALV